MTDNATAATTGSVGGGDVPGDQQSVPSTAATESASDRITTAPVASENTAAAAVFRPDDLLRTRIAPLQPRVCVPTTKRLFALCYGGGCVVCAVRLALERSRDDPDTYFDPDLRDRFIRALESCALTQPQVVEQMLLNHKSFPRALVPHIRGATTERLKEIELLCVDATPADYVARKGISFIQS